VSWERDRDRTEYGDLKDGKPGQWACSDRRNCKWIGEEKELAGDAECPKCKKDAFPVDDGGWPESQDYEIVNGKDKG
jgi:hypothetical protein